jgi:hypothetical protein
VKYLIAGDDENKICYVAIRGIVNLDDVLTDPNLIPALGNDGRCHTVFFSAAQHIPLEKLRDCVKDEGWKLCFCGHSLGGAVAKLLALGLLATNAANTSMHICAESQAMSSASPSQLRMLATRTWLVMSLSTTGSTCSIISFATVIQSQFF